MAFYLPPSNQPPPTFGRPNPYTTPAPQQGDPSGTMVQQGQPQALQVQPLGVPTQAAAPAQQGTQQPVSPPGTFSGAGLNQTPIGIGDVAGAQGQQAAPGVPNGAVTSAMNQANVPNDTYMHSAGTAQRGGGVRPGMEALSNAMRDYPGPALGTGTPQPGPQVRGMAGRIHAPPLMGADPQFLRTRGLTR